VGFPFSLLLFRKEHGLMSTTSLKRTVLLSCMMAAASTLALLMVASVGDAGTRYEVVTKSFSNTAAIQIPDVSPATPYPSQIEVDGLRRSRIRDVNLTLHNLSHGRPDDLDVLVVGPQGHNAIVMSDSGGDVRANNITLKLNDEAANPLPPRAGLTDDPFQAYQPTNNGLYSNDVFPDPAPAPSGASLLSVFDGTRPNGTWKLFIVDDKAEEVGEFAGGWTLEIRARVRR
jgi:subtilisin-like proprotein convertase family protein